MIVNKHDTVTTETPDVAAMFASYDSAVREPDSGYAMFFVCHTNLVEAFKDMFGDVLSYDGRRALMFPMGADLPEDEVRQCVALALTYHLRKTART